MRKATVTSAHLRLEEESGNLTVYLVTPCQLSRMGYETLREERTLSRSLAIYLDIIGIEQLLPGKEVWVNDEGEIVHGPIS